MESYSTQCGLEGDISGPGTAAAHVESEADSSGPWRVTAHSVA